MSERVILDDGVAYESLEHLTYSELFDRYAVSDIGRFHGQQKPRYYNLYPYKETLMHRDLGADVHPVEHGRYTHDEVLVPLLFTQNHLADGADMQQFSPEEIVALRIAAHLHDFGECEHEEIKEAVGEVTGDVIYGTKTEQHEVVEAAIREYLRTKFYEDIPKQLWKEVETIIAGKGEELAVRAFDLTEHVGYYITGLRAGYLAVIEKANREVGSPARDDQAFAQLISLGLRVSKHHREETLPGKTQGFAYGQFILAQTAQLYDVIQGELGETLT